MTHVELSADHAIRYKNIRIDAVHYCELEDILTEKRRRRSRHGDQADPPAQRLQLLSRTVWDNQWLASLVQVVKLPYMTREACKGELARLVSVLPNLRYVDLPESFFAGDPSCATLRQELQARCPDMRKMKYEAGSEQMFEMLLQRQWLALETLELVRLRCPPQTIRRVLGFLPTVHELIVTDMPELGDSLFHQTSSLPSFPPLHSLKLESMPNITIQGLQTYLADPLVLDNLSTISLSETGISVTDLHILLACATNLKSLTVIETASSSMPLDPIPPLASRSLRTLHFEIETPGDDNIFASNSSSLAVHSPGLRSGGPSESYYGYLRSSLMASALPNLRELYVRDPDFPDSLVLLPPPPPVPGFAPAGRSGGSDAASSTVKGLARPLAVYTKGLDEYDWVYTYIAPTGIPAGRRGSLSLSGGRPVSAYEASRGLGPQWTDASGGKRGSVVVGNGFGGFLAVPSEEAPRPGSRGSFKGDAGGGHRSSWWGGTAAPAMTEKRGSRADLWR